MSLRWWETLKELFTHERADADLDRELRSHLDAEVEEQVEQGVPPDEARYAAKRVPSATSPAIHERTREAWRWGRADPGSGHFATGLRQDLAHALRTRASNRRSPPPPSWRSRWALGRRPRSSA